MDPRKRDSGKRTCSRERERERGERGEQSYDKKQQHHHHHRLLCRSFAFNISALGAIDILLAISVMCMLHVCVPACVLACVRVRVCVCNENCC